MYGGSKKEEVRFFGARSGQSDSAKSHQNKEDSGNNKAHQGRGEGESSKNLQLIERREGNDNYLPHLAPTFPAKGLRYGGSKIHDAVTDGKESYGQERRLPLSLDDLYKLVSFCFPEKMRKGSENTDATPIYDALPKSIREIAQYLKNELSKIKVLQDNKATGEVINKALSETVKGIAGLAEDALTRKNSNDFLEKNTNKQVTVEEKILAYLKRAEFVRNNEAKRIPNCHETFFFFLSTLHVELKANKNADASAAGGDRSACLLG